MPLVNQLQPSWRLLMLGITATLPISGMAETATTEQLENRVQDLERELEQAKSAEQAAHDKVEALERKLADVNDAASKKIEIGIGSGKLQIGGAVWVNYAIGDYGDSTGGPSRSHADADRLPSRLFYTNRSRSWRGFIE